MPSANTYVVAAFGVTSVTGVQFNALLVVHPGDVAFVNPKADGFDVTSCISRNVFTGITLRPR